MTKILTNSSNWKYKVIPTDKLLIDTQNHDIAISQTAALSQRELAKNNLQQSLNKLGKEGWEFVTILGEFGIFKKPNDN